MNSTEKMAAAFKKAADEILTQVYSRNVDILPPNELLTIIAKALEYAADDLEPQE